MLASLHQLSERAGLPLPALRGRLRGEQEGEICMQLGINGRKALLVRLRDEVAEAMRTVDSKRTTQLMEQIQQLQFF